MFHFVVNVKSFSKAILKGNIYTIIENLEIFSFMTFIINFIKGSQKVFQKGILKGNIYTIIENLDIFSFMTFIINFIKDS